MRSHSKLALRPLEAREVPAALVPSHSAFDPDHVLVRWRDGAFHRGPVAKSGEALGNGLYRVELKGAVGVPAAVEYLSGRPGVAFVQPDYRVSVANTPNDPAYTSLWGLNNAATATADIGAPEAWNTGTGTGRTIVAVIDSGIDYNHPDLKANMWVNTREIAGNGKDDDGNGFKDDVYGYDFANNDANPMDDNGHGTHVAGTIGAVGNNGLGVSGVAWKTRVMSLKFLDADGSGYMGDAIRALNYAVANGAKVINNSYGGGGSNPAMAAAIASAKNKGVIFVAAAGNDGSDNDASPAYPANYSGNNVVSVAATDRADKLAGFSNFGRTTVDIAAPGAGIYSTLPKGKYGTYSGTSMAAPHVAGALALVWDAHPTWTYRQVIDAVLNTADRVPGLTTKVATGRLNVAKAIVYGTTPTPVDKAPPAAKTPRTYSASGGQWVQDFGTVVSTLTVSDSTTIGELTVRLDLTHTYTKDLQLTLVGPDGTRVKLAGGRGGSGDNFAGTTFSDRAGAGIAQAAAPFAGTYQPEAALSAFAGKSAKGTWSLIVEDTARYDTGRLNSWSLTVGPR